MYRRALVRPRASTRAGRTMRGGFPMTTETAAPSRIRRCKLRRAESHQAASKPDGWAGRPARRERCGDRVANCYPVRFRDSRGRLGANKTPVMPIEGLLEYVMLLTGAKAANIRRAMVDVFVRFIGGDSSLAEQVLANRPTSSPTSSPRSSPASSPTSSPNFLDSGVVRRVQRAGLPSYWLTAPGRGRLVRSYFATTGNPVILFSIFHSFAFCL